MTARPAEVLGVILAGGESRRYGSPKSLATLAGRPLIERVAAALSGRARRVVVVANRPEEYVRLGFAVRPDVRPGTGVLGGILTAVLWAREEGCDVAFVAGCDMPFLSGSLASRLIEMADRDAVAVPESPGPRGLEPLCAAYGIGCRTAIDEALDEGERAVISFFSRVEVRRLPLEAVRRYGDPARLFFNVNRPEDLSRARSWVSAGEDAADPE